VSQPLREQISAISQVLGTDIVRDTWTAKPAPRPPKGEIRKTIGFLKVEEHLFPFGHSPGGVDKIRGMWELRFFIRAPEAHALECTNLCPGKIRYRSHLAPAA